ncbi:hypothetical protein I7H67_08975 [Acinetobacter sp. ACIN00229]|uniref:hypothetical protein n=1 Tax=Acinetobacter sp. ACIN00229 TaxID=2792607 RepID=UPI0018DFD675|nr:hypothetical protein [Acinetobacter sp. ACIN00229]MBI0422934.1 hypothetical protein [Acinetobacter sp. ACIN00229]
MKDWQCKYCNGYIMVNHSKISVGEKVYFLVYKFDAKNERKKFYKKGIVIGRHDNILHIESRKKTYKIEQIKVYPLGAPMPFVYNMFWICGCPCTLQN